MKTYIPGCFARYIYILMLMSCIQGLNAQQATPEHSYSMNLNFVRTWDAKVPVTDPTKFHVNAPTDSFLIATQYVDGLGRPIQTVTKKVTPSGKDLVSPVLYDAFNREQYKYPVFSANTAANNTSTTDGLFKLNAFHQDSAFSKAQYPSENYFYSKNVYEASPLNRVLETYLPGNNWVGTSTSPEANRHGRDIRYGVNTLNDNVQLWSVADGPAGTFGSYSIDSAYQPGELSKLITEDEHGGQTIEFRDKDGKIVLRKVLLTANRDMGNGQGHSGFMNTYYIYDRFNRLRCVLQPVGMTTISGTPGWQLNNVTVLNEQCFRYEYDHRGRVIMKKVPGKGTEEMVYDLRDRLVMVRDSVMVGQNLWMINQYDDLNRLVKIGLKSNTFTRQRHQDSCNNNPNYPVISSSEVMQENFYDNYAWITTTPQAGISRTVNTADITSTFFILAYNQAPYYAQPMNMDTIHVRGKQTGARIRILGTGTYMHSVIFYDQSGRIMQQRGANISGGFDIFTTQYDFSGKPLRVMHRQQKGGVNTRFIRELTKYDYDHAGRVTTVSKKIGTAADQVIATNAYNELGQLKRKTLGNGIEKQDFEYNIQGWLLGANRGYVKSDSTRKFGYELAYDNNQSIVPGTTYSNPEFNGNIGGLIWKSTGDGQARSYDFTYDARNRLQKADFINLRMDTLINRPDLIFQWLWETV